MNTHKRDTAWFHIGESTQRDCYSMMLLAATVLRDKGLAEEYVGGRISEKQFLEALLIETSNHLPSAKEPVKRGGLANCNC